VSAFASAIESASVTAEITVEDVLHLKPAFTRTEAREFLRANAEPIASEMLARAEQVMFTLLKGGRNAN
jgi:hypothetical protein